ncbi:MAG TPA: hypothetical protein VM265_12175 [Sphingomicrobium sp.]|nr:hypothetical protein [Sphingomicrobium sp.]
MTRTLLPIALAAAAALAGCNQEDHTIESGPADPMANALANAAPVELPPSIAASKIYRCKDNSVVYVDWLSDKKTANFRADRAAAPTQLKAGAEGEAMTAEGYSLTGTAQAPSITLTRPGKGSQTCKA